MYFHAGVNSVILQRADHFEAGAIADVGQPRIAMAAEVSLQDAAVFRAVEERAPGFEFPHAVGGFLRVEFGHPPVVQILAAAHGIGEMDAPVIAIVDVGQRRRHSTFSHNRMGLAKQRLANYANLHACGRRLNRRPQARPARADHQDIVGDMSGIPPFKGFSSRARCPWRTGARRRRKSRPSTDWPRPIFCARRSGSSRSCRAFWRTGSSESLIDAAADQVAERVAAEDVTREQHDVDS